jgi:3-hydroxyisobutyrate dehydrogenase
MNKLKVGFIGLGLMGEPMAKNILKKGFPLVVYNRTPLKTKALQKLGAQVAKSPKELASKIDVVITMVTAGKDVENVLFGDKGIIKRAKKGLIVIDMSTIGKLAAIEISKKLKKYGIEFLDAPVTGSTPKAISGELTIFVGGDKKIFEKVKDVLASMGTNLQYMGEVGSGQAIKLINNQLVASTITALAEAMLLADALKLPRKKVAEVLKEVPAMSAFMNLKIENFVSNKFPLLFSASNMKKDVTLAQMEAKKGKVKLPLLSTVEKLYSKTTKKFADQDMSTVIKVIEKEKLPS